MRVEISGQGETNKLRPLFQGKYIGLCLTHGNKGNGMKMGGKYWRSFSNCLFINFVSIIYEKDMLATSLILGLFRVAQVAG